MKLIVFLLTKNRKKITKALQTLESQALKQLCEATWTDQYSVIDLHTAAVVLLNLSELDTIPLGHVICSVS